MRLPNRQTLSASPTRLGAGASRCALGMMLASAVFATLSVGTHLGLQGMRVQRGAFGLAETAAGPGVATSIYAPTMIGVSP